MLRTIFWCQGVRRQPQDEPYRKHRQKHDRRQRTYRDHSPMRPAHLAAPTECPQSDSNRHLADFKSAASANWAMGASQISPSSTRRFPWRQLPPHPLTHTTKITPLPDTPRRHIECFRQIVIPLVHHRNSIELWCDSSPDRAIADIDSCRPLLARRVTCEPRDSLVSAGSVFHRESGVRYVRRSGHSPERN